MPGLLIDFPRHVDAGRSFWVRGRESLVVVCTGRVIADKVG